MIHLNGIYKQFGDTILYKDSSFQINPGYKMGLVGPNGAGKTSIFRLITGEESPDRGNITKPDKLNVAYFSQDVGEMSGRTVLEEILSGAEKVAKAAKRIKEIEKVLESSADHPIEDNEMAVILEEYGDLQSFFEQSGGYDLEARAKEIITGLGIMPEDHHRPVETFSGGWKMRIELAKVLLVMPDVLLMDEPTNHLDLESILWLENWLVNFKGSLLMTSHDRDFMNRIVNRIVSIENQKIVVYTGNYDFYEKERDIRKDQLMASHKRQQDMLAKEEEFIARFAARASHAAQVQSRVKKLEKIDRIEIPPDQQVMKFDFPTPPRSGVDVIKMENLGKYWVHPDGRKKQVFSGISGFIRRLDKVAIVGVNGAGKSTFLKTICGFTDATEGRTTMGPSVEMGYFSQYSLDVLDPDNTVLEEIQQRLPDATLGMARSLLGAFLFGGDTVNKKIKVLSGGEKSRVILATLMAKPLNFLVLDEPTNHLDILSREVLLDAIKNFEGTVAIVSHDRHFLRSIANRVFEIDHGEMRVYGGTYDEYLHKVEEKIKH
ncbi:MAG: ABC-F family ATP-binding cassette domain-containing protein [Xanthomonadaceae bacterium]|nr:ABC-F family ATP-binding cassette domain-containing protein [Xanthomonadaceae bacterium]